MEPLISGFLAIIAEYPFGAGLLIATSGYGVYRWKRPELGGTKGMNGGEIRIYKKLDEMSAESLKGRTDSEQRHGVISERMEVVAGHQTTLFGKMDVLKDELHFVKTDVAVLSERSKANQRGTPQ